MGAGATPSNFNFLSVSLSKMFAARKVGRGRLLPPPPPMLRAAKIIVYNTSTIIPG